jgi:hypothetical protein
MGDALFETPASLVLRKANDILEDLGHSAADCEDLAQQAREAGDDKAEKIAKELSVTLHSAAEKLERVTKFT